MRSVLFASLMIIGAVCGPAIAATPGLRPPSAPTPQAAAPPASAPSAQPVAPAAPKPSFDPPGAKHPRPGQSGYTDTTVFVPGMRFPIGEPNAYANSQVWRPGGSQVKTSPDQCVASNYAYPWEDNFCEDRPIYKTLLCPAGTGHQGQDIRPNSCARARYMAVAAADGVVTRLDTWKVYITGEDGRIYHYLHLQMDKLKVKLGDKVKRGQAVGLVSNVYPKGTTTHLHFEVKQPMTRDGKAVQTFAPPYTSLVDAYERMLAGTP